MTSLMAEIIPCLMDTTLMDLQQLYLGFDFDLVDCNLDQPLQSELGAVHCTRDCRDANTWKKKQKNSRPKESNG